MAEVRHREGESASSLIYRFSKKIQHSGILREAKKRRFRVRSVSRIRRRISALNRERKKKEMARLRKLGLSEGLK